MQQIVLEDDGRSSPRTTPSIARRVHAAIVRELLDGFRDRHHVPAVGACVVDAEGGTTIEVVGDAEVDDQWHIGSCGKSMLAALYARFVERGDAEWGAPLPSLLPDLPADPAWTTATIDAVLVHEAGIRSNLTRAGMVHAFEDSRPLRDQRTAVAADVLARPPKGKGRFRYSNVGYIVAGAVIERLAGTPYEEALVEHLLAPLGVTSAGFGPPPRLWGHGGRMIALGPLGMHDIGGGAPADPADPKSDNPPVMGPAGRLHLTLDDWARFQRLFLIAGGDLLRPETVERLLRPAKQQAMGWAPAAGLGPATMGQQGSNTYWLASALLGDDRAAMVVCNTAKAKLFRAEAELAAELLR